jgi:histidinol-phosphate aminotransferase
MNPFWNSRTAALEPYIPGEQPRDRRFIKLNTNENPYPPAPAVTEAIAAAAAALRLYPDPEALDLRRAIAARFGLDPEQVFTGNGSDEVLAFAFAAFFEGKTGNGEWGTGNGGEMGNGKWEMGNGKVDASVSETTEQSPGSKRDLRTDNPLPTSHFPLPKENPLPTPHSLFPILFPDITYSFYPVYAALWGVPFQTVPLRDDFTLVPEDYLRPNGGVVLCNPNAPTGIALAPERLLPLLERQRDAGRILLVDEAYIDFGAASITQWVRDFPNLLVVQTLSKSRSLAGLRLGFALGDPGLVEGLRRVKDSFNSYTLDRLAQAGGKAALESGPYYDGLREAIIAARERTAAALTALGFQVLPSQANFIFIRHPSIPGAALFSDLRERGILVRRFDRPRIADFLRVTIGTDEEMDEFIHTISGLCTAFPPALPPASPPASWPLN